MGTRRSAALLSRTVREATRGAASPPLKRSKTLPRPGPRVVPLPPMPPRLVRRTLQDNVYDYLREALMVGQLTPGERLTVRGVAAATGTSIMPVREAFRRLTSEGALEPQATGATRVPIFDLTRLKDLTEIRMTVEGLAARLAAQRITEEEFRGLERCNQEVQWALDRRDTAGEVKANEHFHFCIYRAAQSAELLRIIEHLWLQIGPYLAWLLKQEQRPARYRGRHAFRHHADIMEALRKRDGRRAEAALRADLMTAAEILLQQARNLPTPESQAPRPSKTRASLGVAAS